MAVENIIMSPTETDIQTVRIQAESSPKKPRTRVKSNLFHTHYLDVQSYRLNWMDTGITSSVGM